MRVFYRFKETRSLEILAGDGDMNCIIGKSTRCGIDHHNLRGREIPELPHPVRCPGPTGYVEGDVPFPVQTSNLDTIEIFNHPLGRIPVLSTVSVTRQDEICIPAGSPCRFMNKVDNIPSGIRNLRGICSFCPDIINADKNQMFSIQGPVPYTDSGGRLPRSVPELR